MNKIFKIKIDKLIHAIGLKYGLPDDKVREMVESQFEFTAEKIKEIDFNTLKTSEDFENLKSTFLYKSFGKLYLNEQSSNNYLKKKENGRSREHNSKGSQKIK